MSSQHGVVVVGVGIAGKVRIRDILQSAKDFAELKGVHLVGHVSRRELPIEGSKQLNLEEALGNDNVDTIIVCTENERHEDIARQAIEARKNVLMEFPVALTAPRADKILQLAKAKSVVCYEEDISLLSDQHHYVKELVKQKPPLISGKTWLSGRFNGWIEDPVKSGSAFHSGIPQLHRLLILFGQLTAVRAKIERTENSIVTTGTVKTKDGGMIDIDLKREVLDKPTRNTGFLFKFSDDSEINSKTLSVPVHNSEPSKPGLFMRDLIQFFDVVNQKKDGSFNTEMTLRGLKIADDLYELAKNNPESTL